MARKLSSVIRAPLWLNTGELANVGLPASGGQMIRSELVQQLAEKNNDLTYGEVERIVDIFFARITEQLANGGRVELRGFGAFTTRARDARTGRNPRTGETVPIDAKRVPFFKPGKEIRERLNGNGK